jgi:indolepyruvate ferredoxin oxidoreductase
LILPRKWSINVPMTVAGSSLSVEHVGPFRLADRYTSLEGRVFMSGVQALVRVLLDQHRADASVGLRTASLVSGYQGSPLAGFDREVARLGKLAAEHDLVARPAVNEELGATAVWGSQLTGTLPGPRYDGVLGVWYGKAPGVDRAADAIRHGNYVGTDPRGGVLALCGDDPACKSSTIPSASEALLAALHVPILAPGSVQELLDLGRHGIACSRASGLWTAMKVVTGVADATATVEVGIDRVTPVTPTLDWDGRPYVHRPSAHLLAPQSLEMEETLVGVRLELARLYGRENNLNAVIRADAGARVGIVVSGTATRELEQALADLGPAGTLSLRVLKVGMLFPLDPEPVRAFAKGLAEIVVIEEKGPFLERLVKEALYGSDTAPVIAGERSPDGKPLVPKTGILDADLIAKAIGQRLLVHENIGSVRERLEALDSVAGRAQITLGARRTAFFCSGCPHNSSTVADDDAVVGAGIGCHTMVMMTPARRGQIAGITQMGGEGAQWIGAAPFLEPRHFVQNLGDGTFHHSGSLAIRAAVAAKLDVTYKLLYNDAVAMTGGQSVQGQLSVAALARSLEADGVKKIVVTTESPARYRSVALPANTQVRDRSQLLDAQRELAEVGGVTALIHDQACAAELRRARKRGKAPEPPQQVVINERVCEGCGDCGRKSSCLSVEPVETEFGRKTRIHEASCNKDFSCLEGDCPAFLTVIAPKKQKPAVRFPDHHLPPPVLRVPEDDTLIRIVGIGGTGIVTVSQVIGMAALIDGKHSSGLDQTGLSQKAGPVVSDIRISKHPAVGTATPSAARLDLLLCLDLLGATSANLRGASPERTVAITSTSLTPTAQMVIDREALAPDVGAAADAIASVTRAHENASIDAQKLSESLFDDHMPANIIALGAAWQHGTIPLSRNSLHEALRLNGTSVETNLAAFEWGRVAAVGSDTKEAGNTARPPLQVIELVDSIATDDGELRRLLDVRVHDLLGWGGKRSAQRYVRELARIRSDEKARLPGSTALTEAVATGLHKLTAYKDEYEVARLQLIGLQELPPGSKVSFHLHPPLLRALGLKRKLRLGGWFVPCLRVLQHGRRLRGTRFDPFGYAHVRRVERELTGQYLSVVNLALGSLSPETFPIALEIAQLPELIRGYEQIKLDGVAQFHERARELLDQLSRTGEVLESAQAC